MTTPTGSGQTPPIDDPRDDEDENSGDTHAADIVGRTGEEMPIQHHAQVHQPGAKPHKVDGHG